MTRSRSRRRRTQEAPPAGLVAAFTMINPENATAFTAMANATRTYGPAQQIIKLLQGCSDENTNHRASLAQLIDSATAADHGHCFEMPATNPQLVGDTAFRIGFAVCWLLLMTVNGKDGAQ